MTGFVCLGLNNNAHCYPENDDKDGPMVFVLSVIICLFFYFTNVNRIPATVWVRCDGVNPPRVYRELYIIVWYVERYKTDSRNNDNNRFFGL